jgi:hypothetical protein
LVLGGIQVAEIAIQSGRLVPPWRCRIAASLRSFFVDRLNSLRGSSGLDNLTIPHGEPERFVDAATAAAFYSINRRQLLMMARSGAIPAYPASLGSRRKQWRFRLSELAAAITKGLKKPDSETTNRMDNSSRQSRSSRKGS